MRIKCLLLLFLFKSAALYSSDEYDIQRNLSEIQRLHHERMNSLPIAKSEFEQAIAQLRSAEQIDRDVGENIKRRDAFVKAAESEIDRKIDVWLSNRAQRDVALRRLESEDRQLDAELKSLGQRKAYLKPGPTLASLNRQIHEKEVRRSKVRGEHRGHVIVDQNEEAYRKEWITAKNADNAIKHDRFVSEKKTLLDRFRNAIIEFTFRYRRGTDNLFDFRARSLAIESLTNTFLKLTEGFNEVLCFKGGTLVETPDGPREIQTIEPGNLVYACNIGTGECREQTVVETVKNTSSAMIKITVAGQKISATPNHPFRTTDGRWVPAAELKKGQLVLSLINNPNGVLALQEVEIEDINEDPIEQIIEVYNLRVENDETYFAGTILVHNCSVQRALEMTHFLEVAKGAASAGGCVYTLATCNAAMEIQPMAIVGGGVAGGTINLAALVTHCTAASVLCSNLMDEGPRFVESLHVMQTRGFGKGQASLGDVKFPDAKEMGRRLGVNEDTFHRKIKKEIIKDFGGDLNAIGATNPDIGIDGAGCIVLRCTVTKKVLRTGVALASYGV